MNQLIDSLKLFPIAVVLVEEGGCDISLPEAPFFLVLTEVVEGLAPRVKLANLLSRINFSKELPINSQACTFQLFHRTPNIDFKSVYVYDPRLYRVEVPHIKSKSGAELSNRTTRT
jgi:hypothetical protein